LIMPKSMSAANQNTSTNIASTETPPADNEMHAALEPDSRRVEEDEYLTNEEGVVETQESDIADLALENTSIEGEHFNGTSEDLEKAVEEAEAFLNNPKWKDEWKSYNELNFLAQAIVDEKIHSGQELVHHDLGNNSFVVGQVLDQAGIDAAEAGEVAITSESGRLASEVEENIDNATQPYPDESEIQKIEKKYSISPDPSESLEQRVKRLYGLVNQESASENLFNRRIEEYDDSAEVFEELLTTDLEEAANEDLGRDINEWVKPAVEQAKYLTQIADSYQAMREDRTLDESISYDWLKKAFKFHDVEYEEHDDLAKQNPRLRIPEAGGFLIHTAINNLEHAKEGTAVYETGTEGGKAYIEMRNEVEDPEEARANADDQGKGTKAAEYIAAKSDGLSIDYGFEEDYQNFSFRMEMDIDMDLEPEVPDVHIQEPEDTQMPDATPQQAYAQTG
jgi:hypothetical protein